MSNLDKAVEIIAEARRTAPRVRDMQDHISPHIAQALADAGLLAPNLPEPSVTSANGTPVWRADKTLMVTAFPNMIGMWVPDTGEAQYTPGAARAQALALLAAANYAETSHEPDKRQT